MAHYEEAKDNLTKAQQQLTEAETEHAPILKEIEEAQKQARRVAAAQRSGARTHTGSSSRMPGSPASLGHASRSSPERATLSPQAASEATALFAKLQEAGSVATTDARGGVTLPAALMTDIWDRVQNMVSVTGGTPAPLQQGSGDLPGGGPDDNDLMSDTELRQRLGFIEQKPARRIRGKRSLVLATKAGRKVRR